MKNILTISAWVLTLYAANSSAGVFKCTIDGKTTYAKENSCGDAATYIKTQKEPVPSHIEENYINDGFGYRLNGSVNDVEMVFLVDSGASLTSIPVDLAKKTLSGTTCEERMFQTASGESHGCVVKGAKIKVGTYVLQNIDVAVMDGLKTPLLGMNVIQKLGFAKITPDKIVFHPTLF